MGILFIVGFQNEDMATRQSVMGAENMRVMKTAMSFAKFMSTL